MIMATCPGCKAQSDEYDDEDEAMKNIPHVSGCKADMGSMDFRASVKFSGKKKETEPKKKGKE